jgi:hypothetical protein
MSGRITLPRPFDIFLVRWNHLIFVPRPKFFNVLGVASLASFIDITPSTTLADLAEGRLQAASHSACIVVVEAARGGRGWLV